MTSRRAGPLDPAAVRRGRQRGPAARLALVGSSVLVLLFAGLSLRPSRETAVGPDEGTGPAEAGPPGMRWIPAGEFTMGTDDNPSLPNERPAHRVRVDAFWIDEHVVTNAEFAVFAETTGYATTAERAPVWEEIQKQLPPGTPKPPDKLLVPGSLVFTPPPGPVPLDDLSAWWRWQPGANWRHPEGPASSIEGREQHPVVQVSWHDAAAYAEWVGRRLPTEAEWEYAARGGLDRQRYAWGSEAHPGGRHLANTFQGHFPDHQTAEDGFAGTSPVDAFPPNGYGLYDMAGNVWQWTADFYSATEFAARASQGLCDNPTGPTKTHEPADPYAVQRVIKGGSFLCHPAYCESYRPSARRGTAPDTSSSHVGFRLALSARGDGSAEAFRPDPSLPRKTPHARPSSEPERNLTAQVEYVSGGPFPASADSWPAGDRALSRNAQTRGETRHP